MAWNFKNELARKSIHFFSLLIILIYFLVSDFFNQRVALFFLVLILIIFIEFEYLRLEVQKRIPFLNEIWAWTRRRKEKHMLGGDVFFLLGAILVLAIFDTKIAIAAILMTTFGDLAAALVGKKFGKHKLIKNKSWEGTIAELIINLIIGFVVFFISQGIPLSTWQTWIIISFMALTATLIETSVSKLDDNLLIPVFAGFNGEILLIILRRFS
jgi:dolichol kinase